MAQPSPSQEMKEAKATAWRKRYAMLQTPCPPEGHTGTGKRQTKARHQYTWEIEKILLAMADTVAVVGCCDHELTKWTTELQTKAESPRLAQLWEVELSSLAWTLKHVHHTLKECRHNLESTLLITVSPEVCGGLSHLPRCLTLDHGSLSAEILVA